MSKAELPISEEIDFHYLLSLMPPLHNQPEFAWLPELFTFIGYKSLLELCKYAGGETIKIPTLDELTASLNSLEWFYSVYIKHSAKVEEVPPEYRELVDKIVKIYHAGYN